MKIKLILDLEIAYERCFFEIVRKGEGFELIANCEDMLRFGVNMQMGEYLRVQEPCFGVVKLRRGVADVHKRLLHMWPHLRVRATAMYAPFPCTLHYSVRATPMCANFYSHRATTIPMHAPPLRTRAPMYIRSEGGASFRRSLLVPALRSLPGIQAHLSLLFFPSLY